MRLNRKTITLAIALIMSLSSINVFAAEIRAAADTSNAIPGQYIVVLKNQPSVSIMSDAKFVADSSSRIAADVGVVVTREYSSAITGFVVQANDQQIQDLAQNPTIDYIEQDQMMYAIATQSPATWGIDRVDQRNLPLNNSYNYDNNGSGVHAYIIDTGIHATHTQFSGRLGNGWTAINDGNGTGDCNGHGTHVAGTVGGSTYGIAKNVTLHSVRVFGCTGSTSNSIVIDAVNWVANNRITPAVANMSLGGGISSALDSAIRNASSRGVTIVVAAGNENANACNGSPSGEPQAITVASSTRTDSRSSFSNWGSCVDVFAPGSGITSSWYTSNSATTTISGTSMASPHVAGVAALYLQENPSASAATIQSLIISRATSGVISSTNGSPNRLIYSDPSGGSSSGGSSSGGTSSGGTSSGGSGGGSCTSPQYSAGTAYSTGQLVQNVGNEYQCTVGGWCSSAAAWAYEPGVGIYWTAAWALNSACGGSSSGGSSSGGSSSGGTSSGGSSSGGGGDACADLSVWNASSIYIGGDQVQHSGVKYQAKWWTQGQDPAQNSAQQAVWSNLGSC